MAKHATSREHDAGGLRCVVAASVPQADFDAARAFACLSAASADDGVVDFSIEQPSLETVFMAFAAAQEQVEQRESVTVLARSSAADVARLSGDYGA